MVTVVVEGAGADESVTVGTFALTYATRATAAASSIGTIIDAIVTLGYAEPGDCPISHWVAVDAAPAHGVYIETANGRFFELVADQIHVGVLGAVLGEDTWDEADVHADGYPNPNGEYVGMDCIEVFQTAHAYSVEKNVPITGDVRAWNKGYILGPVALDSTVEFVNNYVQLNGQRLRLDDIRVFVAEDTDHQRTFQVAAFGDAIQTFDPTLNDDVILNNVEMRGEWHHAHRSEGYCGFFLSGRRNVIINGGLFTDFREKVLRLNCCGRVRATHWEGERLAKGFIRPLGCHDVQVTHWRARWCDEDIVDPAAEDDQDYGPPRDNILISDFILEGGEGIVVGGARNAIIRDGVIRLSHGGAMNIGNSVNGQCAVKNNRVSGILIENPLERVDRDTGIIARDNDNAAVQIGGSSRSSVSSSSVIPGEYDATAKAFKLPWTTTTTQPDTGALYSVDDATDSSPGGRTFDVDGIQIVRTLPETDDYWGGAFGYYFDQYGWFAPAVHDCHFRQHGLQINHDCADMRLGAITIDGFMRGAAIKFNGNALTTHARGWRRLTIDSLKVVNCRSATRKDSTGLGTNKALADMDDWDVTIRNFHVCIDPYFQSPLRTLSSEAPTGGWDVAPTNNNTQHLRFTGFSNGDTFTLTVSVGGVSATTAAITYSSTKATTASNIDTALENLAAIGAGDMTVTARTANSFMCVFGGSIVNSTVLQMTATTVTGTGRCDPDRLLPGDYYAFSAYNWKGLHVESGTIEHCYGLCYDNGTAGQSTYSNITARCNVVSDTYSASNLGVAVPGSSTDILRSTRSLVPGASDYGQVV